MKIISCILLSLFSLHPGINVQAQEPRDVMGNPYSRNLERAKSAFDKGDLQTAEFYLNACLEKRPRDKDALLLLAMCHQQSGNTNGALRDYTRLIESYPGLVEALYGRGLLLYEKEQYEAASEDFKKILDVPFSETQAVFYKHRPGEKGTTGVGTVQSMKADIYNYLGLCAFKTNRYQKALEYFTEAISRFDGGADFYVNRGLTFEASGQSGRAMEDLRRALEISPGDQIAMYNLARLQSGQPGSNNDNIIKSYTEIIERNPDLAEAYYNRGLALFNSGAYDKALKDFDQALQLDSVSANTWFNRGLSKEQVGDFDGALSDYEHATDLKPNFAKAWHAKGVIYTKMKQYGKAVSMYDLAIHYLPDYALAYYNRGIAKLYVKDNVNACKDLKTAMELGLDAAKKLIDKKCNE